MLTLLAAIFVFGLLVTVHEFGHFLAAKLTGMRVEEFAIGFGPKLYQQREGETLYSLRAVPLGGYNKIAGMDPEEPGGPGSFKSKPIPARLLVVLAGALMNFLLPVLLFSGIFMTHGVDVVTKEPVLGSLVPFQAAERAGLKPGDRILAINGSPIQVWDDVITTMAKNGERELTLTAQREGQVLSFTMQPAYNQELGRPLIGIMPRVERQVYGPLEALEKSCLHTWHLVGAMLEGLQQLVRGSRAVEVAGPIGVAQMAGQVAELGLIPLLNFTAFLSANLGILNLLPLPALDGGHCIILLLEGVRGRPLGTKTMYGIQLVGMVLLASIFFFATFQDIARW